MNSIRVCLADTDELRNQAYHLRYTIYTSEVPSFATADFPNEMEIDMYDEHSVHIVALSGEEVVGTLRLVCDSHNGFVMEPTFPLPPGIDRSKAVEHSRGIIRKDFRNLGLYQRMLEFAYDWQLKNGKPICLGAPNLDKLSGILEKNGWIPIGEATEYHGITVLPMMHSLV